MISVYLKDSVLTTQSRTINEDPKPKSRNGKKNVFPKNVCVLHLVCRNSSVELVSKKKSFPGLVPHLTDKT